MSALAYCIVTPAHNEAAFLPRVMEAIAAQTLKPTKWVIVDDRSTDDTWKLINAAARRYPFIDPVHVQGEPSPALGSNVAPAAGLGCRAPTVKNMVNKLCLTLQRTFGVSRCPVAV